MSKVKFFEVQGTQIMVSNKGTEDYICLTDIVRSYKGGADLIDQWIRNASTVEYLAVWEKYNNPNFNPCYLENIKYVQCIGMSVKKWKLNTNGIGLYAKAGKYNSGTFASKEIALHFMLSINPNFMYVYLKSQYNVKNEFDKILELFNNTPSKTLVNKPTYVYLMKNKRNNLHKIGFSENLEYREKTLHSEEPEINTTHSKLYNTRVEAKMTENYLHTTYANKRVRGEWFNLNEQELNNILTYLK